MKPKEVVELKAKGQTYTTGLRILDDPQTQYYVSQTIGKDLNSNKRMIIKSTAGSQPYISSLNYGDEVIVEGYLQELGFYEKYRHREHIVGIFNVTEVLEVEDNKTIFDSAVQALRNRVEDGCSRLTKDQRGICEGLIIGERGSISRETYSTFRDAQLTHLLVASGANIALMLSFLSPLIRKFSITNRNIIMIFVACFYCMLVRFEPSMIRAAVMVIIPSLFEIRGYKISKLKVFIGTLAACAILDPYLMFRVGFWLSAAAVSGLLFISPWIKTFVKSSIFSDTMGASIMTQPVLWIVFGFMMPGKWWSSVPGVALAGPLTTFGCSLVMLISFLHPGSIISIIVAQGLGFGIDVLLMVARLGAMKWSFVIGLLMLAFMIFAYTRSNVKKPSFLYYWRRANLTSRRTLETAR